MQTLKDVPSRREERENLRNFVWSLAILACLIVAFFGIHASRHMWTDQILESEVASAEIEPARHY